MLLFTFSVLCYYYAWSESEAFFFSLFRVSFCDDKRVMTFFLLCLLLSLLLNAVCCIVVHMRIAVFFFLLTLMFFFFFLIVASVTSRCKHESVMNPCCEVDSHFLFYFSRFMTTHRTLCFSSLFFSSAVPVLLFPECPI